jgi:signal transduction histidine kinase/ActR/RegA family two-component response regulator
MNAWFNFLNWPLRAKLAALLLVASFLPLVIAAIIDIRGARERMLESAAALLSARGDHLADQLDAFHRGYQRSVDRFAHLPEVMRFCQAGREGVKRLSSEVRTVMDVWPASDAHIRGVALLDSSGTVLLATEDRLLGVDLSYRSFVREALRAPGVVTADIYFADRVVNHAPTIAYLAPVRGPDGKTVGLVAFWVHATALWNVMKASNELAGPGSFAVLFDREGIRIAHTYSDDILFHPGGRLDPATLEALVAERRLGENTRTLLEDVRAFPEQFARARAASPDKAIFRGLAPVNQKWNYGVSRRFSTVPWTVFYMIPEESFNARMAHVIRQKTIFAVAIILGALAVGALFATVILRPIAALAQATKVIAGGDLAARVKATHADELGRLGASFNAMAERIEGQARALQKARAELEVRVQERTAELVLTTKELEAENAERKRAEQKLAAQLARLDLLNHITRAIAERQDLQSIFQVVIRSVEESLPVDFCCVCLYDPVANVVTVTSVGVQSAALAMELAMTEHARIDIDQNGLSRCVRGQLVYEPDVNQIHFPFPQRLARGGLRALVAAPLLVESKVFGLLVAARRQPQSFSSGECEFLKQVTEHVALASHQSQLYGALQQAYDDLRQTQQAIMQQERLRALGQMASGIAHDINNAISPVTLYTESLLETEPNLSAKARDYLTTIQHSIEDVAHTVGRMREFYRQRETQLTLTPVLLNRMVDQVADLTRARWSDMPQQRGVVIELRRELAGDLPAVMAVESEIREALINLVFNAVDAMPEGGTLTLCTRRIEGTEENPRPQAEVQVADTGVGMDEDTRRRCLEPFFTTKGERGTGLGLAMVYGTVQRHSADLDITSAPGQGTTVSLRFTLPSHNTVESAVAPADTKPAGRLRLLVVDDDPLLIKSLRDTLEGDGHEIVAATGGQEGIAVFRAALQAGKAFAAVITDLGMPHVDGRQVASAIKAASPATPVILLTGWGQRLVAEGDVPPHVDRVLNKPPKLRELRAALAAVTA